MRFDTVHTLVNRHDMPDFAQFIQMETKRLSLKRGMERGMEWGMECVRGMEKLYSI